MNQQQRAYYEAMRRSQEQGQMRRSHEPQQGMASASQQLQQRSSAPGNAGYSQPYSQYSASSRDSRDSRGSRGSTDGLRMSSGPEMAGVGIFFQQEPQSGKVYVASIVQGGSADRSGVIRINDVIVKVDDEDVQGQPLSNLRNLILGKQGSYVVLAFRRVTGTELYYFDVELVRGTPEYFESLKKNQAIQDEKDKLLNQVRQQEAEIHQLKVQNTTMRSSGMSGTSSTASGVAGGGVDALNRELEQKRQRLGKMEQELKELVDDVASAGTVNLDAEGAARSIKGENKRIQETIAAAESSINELMKRLDVDRAGWDSEKLRMEQQIADAARSKAAKIGTLTAAQEENKSLKEKVAARKAREAAMQARVKATLESLVEACKASEETERTLQDILPVYDSLHHQVLANCGYPVK